MNGIRNTGSVGVLCLGLALSGCATSQRAGEPVPENEPAPPSTRHDVPNAGAMLGLACGRVAIEATFRGGPVGLPVGLAVAGGCLPVALGVGILHAAAPHLSLGAGGVPDTGPAALRKLDDAERSSLPQSAPAGCSDCYANQGSMTGRAEMRRLTAAERSVFPDSSPAGCSDCYASYQVADMSSVEMRKLGHDERSVFPKPSPGCWYGYGC